LGSQLIIPRSFLPSASSGCAASTLRIVANDALFAWFSNIHSDAKLPFWISSSILRISSRVRASMTLGPRVRSPYSAVSLTRDRMPLIP